MAWEIISEESKGPRRQSRLWFRDDAHKVLMNKPVSKLLYRHKFREVNNLPNELRLLEWHKHPLIKLSQNLENCSGFLPNLEKLVLQRCRNLRELHPSIGVSKKLILLNLASCAPLTNLQDKHTMESLINLGPELVNLSLPKSFSGLSTLVSLDLSDCNLLDGALPDHSPLPSLKYLNLSKNNFTCLPNSISEFSKLKILFLNYCKRLKSLPHLPLSTKFVSARGCISLESYSYQTDAGFPIIDSLSWLSLLS